MSAPTTDQEQAGDYATCLQCDTPLPTPEVAREHGRQTLTATGEPGVLSRGHGYRILNPTAAERTRWAVQRVVEDALDSCCEDLESEIDSGRLSTEDVTAALRDYPDIADAWEARRADADEEWRPTGERP